MLSLFLDIRVICTQSETVLKQIALDVFRVGKMVKEIGELQRKESLLRIESY